eukprot:gnl/TRDRNA2_/TRDRNA2_31891_c0_seq1.p2 gnl/TRDRNA2_/TRDRNA2_31891_c0~~gnl/TRDRNA2_/TRDRNA2_31891_c0_seq1.p2  ORF type:complete len:118 (-),score=27.22 gnl/TRDRNA2_/TRDRNA2_31891_c0_seq1:67-420(-)
MLFALGCIQALKCNTNKCPTGITTSDPALMHGLHVPTKAARVYNYQRNTVQTMSELVAAAGLQDPSQLRRKHVMRRNADGKIVSFEDIFPSVPSGALLKGKGPAALQGLWDAAKDAA